MKNTTDTFRSHCPINYGLEAFGDRWSLLILRDIIFRGNRSYGEFLKSKEGFSTNILAARLDHLVEIGILDKNIDPEDSRKTAYTLTEKGLDLIPMLFEMMLWSAKYDQDSEAKRIAPLIKLIQKDNHSISQTVMDKVRQGKAIIPDYISTK